jgi:hypothetical protein
MRSQTKLIVIGAIIMVLLSSVIVYALVDDVEGPLLYQVDILPQSPVVGDTVSVAVYCIDPSGVSGAELHYTLNGDTWNTKEMQFLACLCIAGGRWTASFGPLESGDTPKFYATVFDDSPFKNPEDSDVFTLEIEGSE